MARSIKITMGELVFLIVCFLALPLTIVLDEVLFRLIGFEYYYSCANILIRLGYHTMNLQSVVAAAFLTLGIICLLALAVGVRMPIWIGLVVVLVMVVLVLALTGIVLPPNRPLVAPALRRLESLISYACDAYA